MTYLYIGIYINIIFTYRWLLFSFQILQISPIPLSNYRFRLSEWRKDKDWLRITERSGIVFIENVLLMSNKSTERRNILWWKMNGTHEIPGISKLIININEGKSLSDFEEILILLRYVIMCLKSSKNRNLLKDFSIFFYLFWSL